MDDDKLVKYLVVKYLINNQSNPMIDTKLIVRHIYDFFLIRYHQYNIDLPFSLKCDFPPLTIKEVFSYIYELMKDSVIKTITINYRHIFIEVIDSKYLKMLYDELSGLKQSFQDENSQVIDFN